MTKSRKIGLILAIALIFVLFAASVVPLALGTNTASAVEVVPHEEWKNAYTGTYYNNLNTNKTGTEFRSELASLIISTHKTNTVYNGSSSLALNNVWPHSDKDMDNINADTMKWFYTGTVVSANSFGGNAGQTNREHVWAKNGEKTFGKNGQQAGPGADAHHLRPTEVRLNGTRDNYGFGEVEQISGNIVAENGKKDYGSTADELCYLGSVGSSKLFYPAKGYRGATARILMYMQVRYGDELSLYFVDGVSTSDGKGIGKISDLFKWHLEEPPTTEEIYRNHAIAEIQGNRNPFIDHPEYAEMIYCNDGKSYNSALQEMVELCGSYIEDKNEDNNGGTTTDPTPPDSGNTSTPDSGNSGNTSTPDNGSTTTPPSNGSNTPSNSGSSAKPGDSNNNTKPAKDTNWAVIISVSVVAVVVIAAVVVVIVVVKKYKVK